MTILEIQTRLNYLHEKNIVAGLDKGERKEEESLQAMLDHMLETAYEVQGEMESE